MITHARKLTNICISCIFLFASQSIIGGPGGAAPPGLQKKRGKITNCRSRYFCEFFFVILTSKKPSFPSKRQIFKWFFGGNKKNKKKNTESLHKFAFRALFGVFPKEIIQIFAFAKENLICWYQNHQNLTKITSSACFFCVCCCCCFFFLEAPGGPPAPPPGPP